MRDGGGSDPGDPHVQRGVTEAWGEEVFPKLTFSEAELRISSRWGDLVSRSHMAVGPGHQGLNQATAFIQLRGKLEMSSHKDRKLKMHSERLLREQDTGKGGTQRVPGGRGCDGQGQHPSWKDWEVQGQRFRQTQWSRLWNLHIRSPSPSRHFRSPHRPAGRWAMSRITWSI